MTVAEPAAIGVIETTLPSTVTAATMVSLDAAEKARESPSGSEKLSATSTETASPLATSVWSAIVPSAIGAWLAASTVTSMLCVAESPSGSVAVTVTVVLPAATGEIVTALPLTEAVATPASLDEAE